MTTEETSEEPSEVVTTEETSEEPSEVVTTEIVTTEEPSEEPSKAMITEELSDEPVTTEEPSEEPSEAVITEEPSSSPPQSPLSVRIVSGNDTLRAGQNHIFTCEASGGGSMAYTYKWLKDDSVVSGQTSSTYSFSPLLVVDSGQYNCRVSVGSKTVTSEGVDITVESESGSLTQLQLSVC